MKTDIATTIEAAEKQLRQRQFADTLRILEGIERDHLCAADQAYLALLEVEARLYLGDYNVESIILGALAHYKKTTDIERFGLAKFLHGWLLITKGEHFEAREVLLESYAYYKRCDRITDQARVLNRLGLISLQIGEIAQAFNQLEKAIELYEQAGNAEASAIVWKNLAGLYYSHGLLSKSIETYMGLIERRREDCGRPGYFYSNLALPYGLKGDIGNALKFLSMAQARSQANLHEQGIYYENLGWIHLLEGDYESAEKALLEGLKISLEIAPESALISQIKRRMADAYLGLGKDNLARQYADEAMIVAEKINERVEIAAVWRVYALLAGRAGDESTARDWFKKAIDLFAMISSRYELAATRYLAATSGAYHNGERQALLYLAREYFESESVTHYVEKINAELTRVRRLPMPRPARRDGQPPKIVAVNAAMKRLVELAEHVAPSDMTVFLTGPTGSGKDLLARFIHYHSGRTGKFVSVNAAAIPDQMVESELFGYKKGAYTGADKTTTGLFEEADGGTFYLNEIANASLELQAKLLDVLETKNVRRLGEREPRTIDFRLIAATNHDVEQMIRDGRFRPDLYHRLNEIPLMLPPLSARPEDIPALVAYFLRLSGVTLDGDGSHAEFDRLARALSALEWPGNVRELKSQVERLVLMTEGDIGRMLDFLSIGEPSERERLAELLAQTDWNRSRVAEKLGISEGAVRHRMKKYDLTPDDRS